MTKNTFHVFCFATLLALLSGCAATQVALSKKDLDVQTKMSASLFLDPVEKPQDKTLFVQFKNSSDKADFQLTSELQQALRNKGFRIVSNSKAAHYFLQVNVLQVGKMDPSAAESAVYKGYGMDGVALGAGAAYVAGAENNRLLVGAGILGGIAAVVADSLVKDVHFSVITDLQIKEKVGRGAKAVNTAVHYNQSGTSGGVISTSRESSDWKIYQTRILSSANKVNLEFNEAAPELKKSLVQSIAAIF
jgi:hypothetical protein